MKFFGFLVLIIFSIILCSCDSSDDSVLSSNYMIKNSDDPSYLKYDLKVDILDIDEVITISKEINGASGGRISLDTVFIDQEGNVISIEAALTIKPNSFTGIKNISITPDPSSGSIRFTPAILFDIPVELNLKFKGINLSRLGFNSNSIVDFVFCAENGSIESILKNECKIKWNSKEIYVKNAKLQHFSRYIFVR